MIAIIDYGAGNIGSVLNMFKKLGISASRAADQAVINSADALILPGVGAFDFCMGAFNSSDLRDAVENQVFGNKKPLLGICVGFQMMFSRSEEGREPGLNWMSGQVVRFNKNALPADLKIPHMGWSNLRINDNPPLFANINCPRFYFVHSYHAVCDNLADVSATAKYGYEFCCAASHDNIHGVQFHPEKSHRYGMQLFKNFAHFVQGD